MKHREERNEYLKRCIDLFTRSAEKEYEDKDYLYNKYNDRKLLCKHYLYECNISNDNDIFNTMKSIYGLPPKDGLDSVVYVVVAYVMKILHYLMDMKMINL